MVSSGVKSAALVQPRLPESQDLLPAPTFNGSVLTPQLSLPRAFGLGVW
jgi:hypothetical protein